MIDECVHKDRGLLLLSGAPTASGAAPSAVNAAPAPSEWFAIQAAGLGWLGGHKNVWESLG